MFKKLLYSLLKYLDKYTQERRQHLEKLNDLDRFNDNFAKSVSWDPIVKSRIRSAFCTKRMVKSKKNRISFKPSIQFLFFILVFIGVPSLTLVKVFVIAGYSMNEKWPLIPFMSVFFLIGIPYCLWELKPIYFDLNKREFIKKSSHGYEKISIDHIHALQMIKDRSHLDENYYELNVVLKNHDRLNIICHSNGKSIRKQAKELSEILSIPFWDMTT
ncbi:Uncharacterized protein dnl_59850 [Desulfonema limicola]|uniref:Uncharacterized protein n=2 Tax=Desulfonema limicola TaxID=45656 RepID=A0A975BDL6_9BACT|nr:Uncharacterized protein dnl_59850 [Desulfonema limicola]